MRRPQRESGQALVEFALTSLLFFTLILFILDGSIILWNQVTLSAAVAYGARYASTHGLASASQQQGPVGNYGKIEERVRGNAFGLNPANLQIVASWPSKSNAVGQDVTVVLTYTVTPVTNLFWPGLRLELHARQTAEIVN
jgi:hypothetical protein